MSEEKTPEYEVRLWCENGDLLAYAEVYIDTVGWKVDYYTYLLIETDRKLPNVEAENSARRWVMSQDEYDTEGHIVQVIRNGQDVTSDPCESF